MATTTSPKTPTRPAGSAPAGQYVDFDEYVDYHLEKVRVGVKMTDVLTAAAGIAALVLGYLLVFVVCDHWIVPGGFGQTARTTMLLGIAVAAVAWVTWKVVIPARRRVTALYAADMIERAEPELGGNLRNLIDLRRAGRPAPEVVKGTMEKRAALHMTEIDVDTTVDRTLLLRTMYTLLAVVVVGCLYVAFSPKSVLTSVWRALAPTTAVGVATRTEILEVAPGDAEVLARSRLDVHVDVTGERPERVVLLYTTADRRFVDEPLELREDERSPKRYVGTLVGENGRGILQSLSYRIEAGDATSDTFEVTVVQPPAATMKEVTVTPPTYTKLPEKTRQGGHVDAFEGSTIRWTATTNQKVDRAVVQFSDDETFANPAEERTMQVLDGGRTLTATLENWARRDLRDRPPYPKYYRVQVWNERDDSDPEPTAYRVNMKLDLPPEVLLIDPAEDLVGPLARPANGTVPLTIEARDDFGLKSIRLKVQKENETIRHEPITELDTKLYTPAKPYPFRLADLGLKPGDVIEVTLQAKDNKEPFSQASPLTTPLRIEIASPADPEQLEQQAQRDQERRAERVDEHQRQRGEADERAEGAAGEGQGGQPGEGGQPQQGDPRAGEGDPMNAGGEGGADGEREGQPGEGANDETTTDGPPQGGERPDGPREGNPADADPANENVGPQDRDPAGDEAADESLSKDGRDDDLATQELIDKLLDDPTEPKPPEPSEPTDPMPGEDPQPGEPGGGDPMGGGSQPEGGERPAGGEKPGDPKPEGGSDQPTGSDPSGGTKPDGTKPDGSKPEGGSPGTGGDPMGGANTDPPKTEETLDSEINDPNQIDNDSPPQESDVDRLIKEQRDEKRDAMNKEQVEEELDRLQKQKRGEAGGERKPGDPKTPEELDEEIEQLQKRRDELAKQNPMGGETNPRGGDPMGGDPMGGDPMGGDPMGGGGPMDGGPMENAKPGSDPMKGNPSDGGKDPMGGKPGDPKPGSDPMKGGNDPGNEGAETLEKKPTGDDAETLEKIDDEIERLEKQQRGEPGGERKPGDPESPEKLDDEIERLKRRRDEIESGASEPKPADPMGGETRPGEPRERPMGDERPGRPSKEQLDREIERLEKRRDGDPTAEPRPGDPRDREELADRIEQLKKERDERGEPKPGEPGGEPMPGGEPGGEPKPGEPGGEPMPGGEQPGGEPMAGGEKPGGQPGGEQPGAEGQPGNQSGAGQQPGPDGRGGNSPTGGGQPREGAGESPKAGDFEGPEGDANLPNAKKATELVLDKLEGQLERGEVDQELLDRLGWTENDLRNYVDRMKERFRTFEETEARPESEARRRQFEEMLRGLDFQSKADTRRARTDRKREVEGFGGRDVPAPPEYREAFDAFSRSLPRLFEESGEKKRAGN